ncbi:MAG: TraR/DksA C4-type zinc finger protein [Desulfobulbus sp.]|nr:TraR/DksA C4-type zinc finger protein [Desulfobulbus sp.]
MDEADHAQASREHFDRLALKRCQEAMPQGESALECEDCGEPIPEARRKAAQGCTRCVDCQQTHEQRRPR